MEKIGFADVFWLAVLTVYISHGTAICAIDGDVSDKNRLPKIVKPVLFASCELRPNESLDPETASTNDVTGRVLLRHKLGKELEIRLNASGLDPEGSLLHGFHIHEYGDLSDGCESTGSHYNPFNEDHGGQYDTVRHVGDLGNVERDDYGNVLVEMTDYMASLWGSHSIYGRALLIHADEDDLGDGGNEDSLTTGNAGARLACCVIGHATMEAWDA